jgi:DNA-binding MarR family transcriptional regulator
MGKIQTHAFASVKCGFSSLSSAAVSLAQPVLAPQPTVTRQLDRMVAKGLVQRIAHASDRRLTLAPITPRGQALARGLIERARAHERRALAPFGRERAMLLKLVLAEMIEQRRRPAAQAR